MSFAGNPNAVVALALRRVIAGHAIVVAAAGNGGPDAPPAFPAAEPGVIAVTAVDSRAALCRRQSRRLYRIRCAGRPDLDAGTDGDRELSYWHLVRCALRDGCCRGATRGRRSAGFAAARRFAGQDGARPGPAGQGSGVRPRSHPVRESLQHADAIAASLARLQDYAHLMAGRSVGEAEASARATALLARAVQGQANVLAYIDGFMSLGCAV